MNDLRSKLQDINHKLYQLQDNFDKDNDIDYWTLQEEINDSVYMMVHINSKSSRRNKLSAIEAINNHTSSELIYDTVKEYITTERRYMRTKLGLGIGIGAVIGLVVYKKIKKSKKKVLNDEIL
jgi:hypothetical protein